MSVLTPLTTSSTPSIPSPEHRIDAHLATEIGQRLVVKMRCMQSTIRQQQDILSELSKQLHARQTTEEKLNKQLWDLELAKQEYTKKLEELNRALARSHLDQVHTMRQSHLVNQELELLKDVQRTESSTGIAVANTSPPLAPCSITPKKHCRPESWTSKRLEPAFSEPTTTAPMNQQQAPRPFSLPPPPPHDMYARLMTGDWMWKSTRSKTRHARFVWVEPGANALYWCHASQQKTAVMLSFAVETSLVGVDRMPSLVIKTLDRQIKLQCMTMEAHRRWVQGLNALLQPGVVVAEAAQEGRLSRLYLSAEQSIRNLQSFYRKDISVRNSQHTTPSPYDSKVQC